MFEAIAKVQAQAGRRVLCLFKRRALL